LGGRTLNIRVLDTDNVTNGYLATFSPLSGTVVTAATSLGAGVVASATITALLGGWYRVALTGNAGAACTKYILDFRSFSGTTGVFAGDTGKGLFLWGAQLEQGAFPTSYIPTQASTRTRAVDNAQITGRNFNSWYNPNEGSIFCDAKGIDNNSGGNTRRYYEFNNQGSGNFRILSGYPNSTTTRLVIVNNGLVQADLFQSNQSPFKNNIKTSSSFGINYFRFYSNGVFANDDNFGTLPTVDRVFIGGGGLSPELVLNGTVKRFTYYPKRLPNSQLQALTR
jgi:hypothetical protein